jgi:hypothetical protein
MQNPAYFLPKSKNLPQCATTFTLDNTIPAPQNKGDSNGAGEPQSLDFPLSYGRITEICLRTITA